MDEKRRSDADMTGKEFYESGKQYFKEGKLDEAISCFQSAANRNYPPAQFFLGVLYRDGHGVEKNETKAFEWFQKSAENGNADAQNNLGICYEDGKGTEIDLKTAAKYYYQSYFRVQKNRQEKVRGFFKLNNYHQFLTEIEKISDPVSFVKELFTMPDKDNLEYELLSLLKNKKISETLINDQQTIDLICDCLFYNAIQNYSTDNINEAIIFYHAIPQNSIFYPFALDQMALMLTEDKIIEDLSKEEFAQLKKLREEINRLIEPYQTTQENSSSPSSSSSQVAHQQLTEEQAKLLSPP